MSLYSNILVYLDRTEKDAAVVAYAKMIAGLSSTVQMTLLYVSEESEFPDEVQQQFPKELDNSVSKEDINDFLDQINDDSVGYQINTKVAEGSPVHEILGEVYAGDYDLIVLGKDTEGEHVSPLPVRITMKATCSVLIVPGNADPEFSKVMVPVDFSDYSRRAAKAAISLTDSSPVNEVYLFRSYEIPLGYSKEDLRYESFKESVLASAEDEFDAFIARLGVFDADVSRQITLNGPPAEAIAKAVKKQGFDLLVLGTKGKNALAAVLLGSTVETLINALNVPLLAVEKKGEGDSLLEVWFGD